MYKKKNCHDIDTPGLSQPAPNNQLLNDTKFENMSGVIREQGALKLAYPPNL